MFIWHSPGAALSQQSGLIKRLNIITNLSGLLNADNNTVIINDHNKQLLANWPSAFLLITLFLIYYFHLIDLCTSIHVRWDLCLKASDMSDYQTEDDGWRPEQAVSTMASALCLLEGAAASFFIFFKGNLFEQTSSTEGRWIIPWNNGYSRKQNRRISAPLCWSKDWLIAHYGHQMCSSFPKRESRLHLWLLTTRWHHNQAVVQL